MRCGRWDEKMWLHRITPFRQELENAVAKVRHQIEALAGMGQSGA
jgi:hypothetical protein